MSCIYKYKGKKYSEEQFKEYFINNKNEFAISISKNKDVIDSFKRKMEGIDFVFSQSPELASIGSKSQYLQYLSTIFPNSKAKDIVYHGSSSKIEKFDISKSKVSDVIYFSNDIKEATYYANKIPDNGIFIVGDYQYTYLRFEDKNYYLKKEVKIGKETLSKQDAISKYSISEKEYKGAKSKYGDLNPSLINIKNLYQGFGEDLFFGGSEYFKGKGYDGFITNNDAGQATILAVFEPEQIHILGSKQDIQGFKTFIKENILLQQSYGKQDLGIREKYFKDSPVTDSVTILTKIGNSDHPLAPLAKQLLKYAKLNNVSIILDAADYISVNGIQAAGVYRSKLGEIQLAEFANFRGKGSEATIIHEILHSLTYNALRDNTQTKEDLEKLYKAAKSAMPEEYATLNLDEFLVALFTDSKFIKQLLEVKPVDDIKYKNLLEQIFDYILGLFKVTKTDNLYEQAFAVATNILEYAHDKESYLKATDNYEDLGDASAYVYQMGEYEQRTGNKATKAMKETIDKLYSSDLTLSTDEKTYVNSKGEHYQRTGDFIKGLSFNIGGKSIKNYFEFGGNEEEYEANRNWGNQIDRVLTKVIEGASLDEVLLDWSNENILKGYKGTVSKEAIINAYNQFKEFVDTYDKNAILIPQVTVKSDVHKIAGTTDLIAVYPDGLVKVIDLKSSKDSIDSKDDKGINKYTKVFFLKDGDTRASKKQKHSAQLSVYKALIMSMGVHFKDENDLSILPMYLSEIDEEKVTDVELEKTVPIDAYKQIIDALYTGEDTKEIPKGLLDNIKILLKTREISLKNQSSVKNVKWKKYALEKLQREIRIVEDAKAIVDFIDSAYSTIVKSTNASGKEYQGILHDINNIIYKINNKKIAPVEAINELYYYKALLDNYKPVIEELKNYYTKEIGYGNDAKENTPLWKLEKIISMSGTLEELYYERVLPEIANVLAKQVPDTLSKDTKKIIEEKEKTIERLIKEGNKEKYIEKIKKDIQNIKKSVGNTFEENKALILKELIEGSYRDIGSLDAHVVHAAGTNNLLLSTFVKTLLEGFENSRLESLDFEREAVRAFEEYKGNKNSDNPAKFNEDFLEEVTGVNGNKTLQIVQPLDINAYNIEKAKAMKSAEESPEKAKSIWTVFYKENHIALPEEDISITNPVTKEKIVLIQGKKSLREEKVEMYKNGIINRRDLESYIGNEDKLGSIDYITIPDFNKFKNKKYEDLIKSKEKKKYYDYLISSYFKSQEVIPLENRPLYRVPSIAKSMKDSLIDDPLAYGKRTIKDITKILPQDEVTFGNVSDKTVEGVLNEQEHSLKTIPVLFSNYMPIEDISRDLITSIISYNTASLKYKAQSELSSFSNVMLETVQKNAPLKQNSIKENVLDSVSRALGVSEESIKNRKKQLGDNNIATAMAAIIDMHIYGKINVKKIVNLPVFGDVELNKLFGNLMGYAAFTQIGGNPLLSIVNYLNGNVQVGIESAANKYFNAKEIAEAKVWYDKLVANGTFIKDFVEPVSKSLEGQLIELYDPLQGEFKDLYGRKISQSVSKKLMSRDTWFFLQRMSEHSFQVQTMRAILKRAVVKQGDKTISLYDAYELDSKGNIKLKDGVVLPGNISTNKLVALDIQNTLHGINKSLHGVYNSFDKVALERHWYGKLILMYKKFFVPGIRRRYRSAGIDYETGAYVEGYYRTFYSLMIRDTKQMLKYLTFQSNELTELEKQNIKRAVTEMGVIMATGAFTMLLMAKIKDSDDDDEKRRMQYLLYLTMRLNTEIGVFGGLGDPQNAFIFPNLREMKQVIRQPFALWSVIDKLFRFLNQLQHPTEVYKRDSGIFKKGDSKLVADLIKFWGISGVNFSPEVGTKWLTMQTK